MEERQRRSFTDDYKRQAVDLVASSGPPNGCSPWVRPFPPRPPPGVASPCSVASQVLWPHPTSHPRTCSACGLSPSRAGPAHEPGMDETSRVPRKELLHVHKVSD